nr:PepSY domain-containing protein [uncultured Actinoplanes sp.]
MNRRFSVAAAIGAAAVLGLAGSALAGSALAATDAGRTPVPPAVSPSARSGFGGFGGVGGEQTRDEAARAAMDAAGGGSVSHVEAEDEHGRAIWKIRVMVNGARHDVYVDRGTGEVTRHDVRGAGTAAAPTGSHGDDRGRGRHGRGRGSGD